MFSSRNQWLIPLVIVLLVSGGVFFFAVASRTSVDQGRLLGDYFLYLAVLIAFGAVAMVVYLHRRRSGRTLSSGR
jgi:uncharacterized membrane protein SirB2